MEYNKRKDGYGYLIKWIIGLGDMFVVNLSFFLLCKLGLYLDHAIKIVNNTEIATIFLLINLVYFVTVSLLPTRLFSNIIFFDKVIQRSFSFITLYFVLFIVGCSLFQLNTQSWTVWIVLYIGLCSIYSVWHTVIRIILKTYRSKGYNYKRVVIVGNNESVLNIYNEMKSGDYGYKILGFFSDISKQGSKELSYLGRIDDVSQFCIDYKVDEIYCTLPSSKETEIIGLVNFAEKNMIRFFLVPDFYEYIHRKLVLNFLQSTPIIAIRPEPLQLRYNRVLKRMFDIVFSSIVLVTVFPLVFVIFSILIKLSSPGPIFFKQERTGLKGNSFFCYKFRSMNLNSESDIQVATENDPRITKVGRFMRRTSIDELPQFFNVLIGNMSVVGPRPHMTKQTLLYNQLIDKFMIRHLVKPGITGWAQISGFRGETKTIEKMEGRFKKDVWYIENWSFVLDIKIIFVTVLHILKGDDKAY